VSVVAHGLQNQHGVGEHLHDFRIHLGTAPDRPQLAAQIGAGWLAIYHDLRKARRGGGQQSGSLWRGEAWQGARSRQGWAHGWGR
jgi:hypothetical protein